MSQFSQNPYYKGGGGGGGFMAGDSPFGSNSGTPGSGHKRNNSPSVRPVTIKQILTATQVHSEADWVIDNAEVGTVTVVAQVISIQKQATNIVYNLDDGTGRLEARHWVDPSAMEEDEEEPVTEGVVIYMMGNIKAFSNKRYINTSQKRVSKDPHEIYFHLLNAMTTKLQLERGPPNGSGVPTVSSSTKTERGDASAYTAQATISTNNQWASLPAFHQQVLNAILSHPASELGVDVGAIAKIVGGQAAHLSATLDSLLDGGHIYTTVDESHFAVSQ
ncbi:hypothetical protein QCA50_003063 [Cerrena zonata]|uniref:Replication protein A C-terminal domain-containing protein n=1 Tax=Cerrena zonata TaxID=2478898 RepID=A0AAW0GJK5_9APHY